MLPLSERLAGKPTARSPGLGHEGAARIEVVGYSCGCAMRRVTGPALAARARTAAVEPHPRSNTPAAPMPVPTHIVTMP